MAFPSTITTTLHAEDAADPPATLVPLHWLHWKVCGPVFDKTARLRARLLLGDALHHVIATAAHTSAHGTENVEFDAPWAPLPGIPEWLGTGSAAEALWAVFGMEGAPAMVRINGRLYVLFMHPDSGY